MKVAPINTTEILNIINNNSIKTNQTEDNFIPFADMLSEAIQNVVETDQKVQEDAIKIAAGDTDALHTLTINMAKADLAIQTLIQVRNKALDAYNEIMRITL